MSYINDIVIPGETGRVFTTNIKDKDKIENLKTLLLQMEGVTDVIVNQNSFPSELRLLTDRVLDISDLESVANTNGYHIIPKSFY